MTKTRKPDGQVDDRMAGAAIRCGVGPSVLVAALSLALPAASGRAAVPVPAAVDPGAVPDRVETPEVVVTARHRSEDAQSVPISVTTVDASQIRNLGALNLNQIKQLTPSLTINGFQPRHLFASIRNLGSSGFTSYDGLEGGVGIYIDGVLAARGLLAVTNLPEISTIEVLRGPQGTLFGKNAIAGAVNITTRAPSFRPEADFSASYGNYHYWQLQGYATTAIGGGDKVALSISAQATERDGYIKDIVDGRKFNNIDDKGGRVQLLLKPNDDLTARIIAGYDDWKSYGGLYNAAGVVTNYANGAPITPSVVDRFAAVGYVMPTQDIYRHIADADNPQRLRLQSASLSAQIDYAVGGFTLSSITAGSYFRWNSAFDGDGVGISIINYPIAPRETQRQFTQEFRVTSPAGHRIDFTAGLYLLHQRLQSHQQSRFGQAAPGVIANSVTSADFQVDKLALTDFGGLTRDRIKTDSIAAYGQATLHLTGRLDLTGGARITYEDKRGSWASSQYGGVPIATVPSTQQAAVQSVRNAFAPALAYTVRHDNVLPGGLATLAYKPGRNLLIYATYSHGEKSAGLNLAASALVPKIVAPEKIDNYEIGFKSTLLNGHLSLNADVFLDADTDYQQVVLGYVGTGTVAVYLSNVPKVRSRGVELDMRGLIGTNLSLFASATYDQAIYTKAPSASCPIEVQNVQTVCSLTGRPLIGASSWSGAAGGEYRHPLPGHGGDALVYVGGNVQARSGFYSQVDDSRYSFVHGYAVGNIVFGVRQADGRWDLSGWVHNVTDSHYLQYRLVNGGFPLYNRIWAGLGDPITFGVTLRTKFR